MHLRKLSVGLPMVLLAVVLNAGPVSARQTPGSIELPTAKDRGRSAQAAVETRLVSIIRLPIDTEVSVQVIEGSHGATLDGGMLEPIGKQICANCHGGEKTKLGTFRKNTKLVFGLSVNGAAPYLSTDSTHALITRVGRLKWTIDWEDSVDADFNDLAFQVIGRDVSAGGLHGCLPAGGRTIGFTHGALIDRAPDFGSLVGLAKVNTDYNQCADLFKAMFQKKRTGFFGGWKTLQAKKIFPGNGDAFITFSAKCDPGTYRIDFIYLYDLQEHSGGYSNEYEVFKRVDC